MGLDKSFTTLLCQEALTARGLYTGALDDLNGPQTKAAMSKFLNGIRAGSPVWTWFAEIQGNDLIVNNASITAFGGADDEGDNGETASGFSTKDNPTVMACSLPMDGFNLASLKGSPIPKLPFGLHPDGTPNPNGTNVIVTFDGKKSPPLPLIDIGPARKTGNQLDLTVAAAQFFHPQATANNFQIQGSYRILNAVKYL